MPAAIDVILSTLSACNLTGWVPLIPRSFAGGGGFSDIYKGHLSRIPVTSSAGNEKADSGGSDKPLVVAIKIIREHLKSNQTFEKVRPRVIFHYITRSDSSCWYQAFCKELYIWKNLKHVNIVKAHGFVVEEEKFPSIILEWASNGTVIEYVKANRQCNRVELVGFSTCINESLAKILMYFQCQGIAEGIAYLHILKNVIHSDLKGVSTYR